MVIAIVINTSWNIYNFRQCLVNDFLKKGYRVIAIAPRDKYAQKLIDKGCEFVHLKMNNKGVNPIEDIGLILRLRKIYKRLKPDVILQYTIKPNIYGSIAAKSLGIPAICNVSGLGTTFLSGSLLNKIARALYRFGLKRATHVFFQNEDDQNIFVEGSLVKKDCSSVLPGSGINLSEFKPSGETTLNEPRRLLFIARLLFAKGIREFIEMAEMAQKEELGLSFLICGSIESDAGLGISEEELKVFTEAGIVQYLGHVDNVPELIESVDAVVLPSYREGTPRALIEAIALGKPIMTTDVPGCKEVFNGANGFLCNVEDSKDLFLKVKEFCSLEQPEYNRMCESSRSLAVSKFDEAIIVNMYKEQIEKV